MLNIRDLFGLSFAIKRIGLSCCTFVTIVTCYLLQIILLSNYLLPLLSVLAEITLLKTAYHFLLLLVGFDTLTYRKDYDRSPILVGHQPASGGRQRAQRPRFLFGAKEASAGEESRGIRQRFPYRCNETKTSRTAGRRSPWSPRRRHHQSLWQAKTTFSHDNLY